MSSFLSFDIAWKKSFYKMSLLYNLFQLEICPDIKMKLFNLFLPRKNAGMPSGFDRESKNLTFSTSTYVSILQARLIFVYI